MQLIHPALAPFRDGLKRSDNRTRYLRTLFGSQEQKGQNHCGWMSDSHRCPREIHSRYDSDFAFDPWSADDNACFRFQTVREIDNVARRFTREVPRSSRKLVVRRKKGKVDTLHVFRQNTLNKSRLIANRLKLSQRFVVIQQANILCRKIPLAEDILQFASLQRSSPHNRNAKQGAPVKWFGV